MKKIVSMGILLVIHDGVYLCICKVYSFIFKEYTQHAFFYDSSFSQLENSECCGAIIDNISYSPIYALEEKYRKIKTALNIMIRKFFDGTCIVEYALKVTVNKFS